MSEKDVELFQLLFPDSEIAKSIKLKKSKIAYSILYGIAPYFKTELITNISKCEFFTVGFDESLNKVSQKTQMDINVRFWCNEQELVCTRYLTSAFLSRTTADEIRRNFKEALSILNISKMVQISMDGPNVNHKFFKDLKAEIRDESQDGHPIILNMGSCGLHVLHGAFKTGIRMTNWSLIQFLRSLYNLFKGVPARRALFVQYTGSNVFPIKFCPVRWLQNGDVAQRAIDMIPHLRKFISGVKLNKDNLRTESFINVCAIIEDPLLEAKLQFFKSLIAEVEPFLEEFQKDAPLVPFLYSSLHSICLNIISKFVKDNIIKENSLHKIDFSKKDNFLPADKIDLGYAARNALKKRNKEKKIADNEVSQFRNDCLACYKSFVSKLFEKSPLLYPLTKAVTCFDPDVAIVVDLASLRIKNLLTILMENAWIDGPTADKAERQYKSALKQNLVIELLKNFNRTDSRVDVLWRDVFKLLKDHHEISKVMKLTMSLYNGNANVERGFSVNSQCLIENLKEETLISQRIVYDTIISTVKNVNSYKISKPLVHSFRNAHSLMKEDTKKRKLADEENLAIEAKKKKTAMIKKELEKKIAKIKEDASKEISNVMEQIDSL
nr:uncharacterized protein LOC122270779 [Parasteatoda tepidariorum]